MKDVNITISIDARKYNTLLENYEGTVEGFLEYELAVLYDEEVPPEKMLAVEADIKREEDDHAKNKFALICMKDENESFYVMTDNCKTFLDVAKTFAIDIHDYLDNYYIESFKSSFGDYDEINEMAFNIMSESCGTDKRIGVVAVFDMSIKENTLAVKTLGNPTFRVFDLDNLYRATTKTINRDHAFYCDQLKEFDEQLGSYEAEIHIEEQGENEDSGMQM